MRKRSRKGGRVGIRKVTVPNLSGLTRSQAQSLLSSLGLNYSESTTNTSTLALTDGIASQGSAHSSTVSIGSTVPFVYYNYVDPVVITYGPCESYGTPTTIGSGTQCSGEFYEEYTDYRYNTRKKIYADGVWDGFSYTTSGCGTTDSRIVSTSVKVNGQCGYVTPPVITYGACETYGTGTVIGSGNQCSGTYYQQYTDYRYNTRKKIYSDGVWDGTSYSTSGCGTSDSREITSSSQIDGSCGYTAPCSITSYSGWDYSGITWSGNCVSSVEAGTATSRSRTDNCGNTYNESGSYSVSRSCTPPATITYGPCEAYGSGTNVGSGSQCSGTYYQTYTDYVYNTRKQIYVNGSWDGSSYTTSGCGTTTSRSITGSSQVEGLCGYTNPITYGPCEAYGSGTNVGSGFQCSGTYYQNYTDYVYNSRKKIYVNGSWDGSSYTTSGCGTVTERSINSSSQVDGTCGYTAPAPAAQWYCTTSINGGGVGNCEYTMPGYNNSASGSGYSRQCVFGYAYPGCQSTNPVPVCTSYKYNCKSYDVTNSASNNYYQCYGVGDCTANNNSDGSRTTCCASYG